MNREDDLILEEETLPVGAGDEGSSWDRPASLRVSARRCAAVAIAFSCVVLGLLTANAIRSRAYDPLDAPRFDALLVELNRTPTDAALKSRVRSLDQKLRSEYRRSRAFALDGLYLLLGGVVLFLLANEYARPPDNELPRPDPNAMRRAAQTAPLSRGAVLTMGIAFGGLLLTLSVLSRHDAAADYARESANLPAQAFTPPGCGALKPGGQQAASIPSPGLAGIDLEPVTTPSVVPTEPVGGHLGAGNMDQAAPATAIRPQPLPQPISGAKSVSQMAVSSVDVEPFCPKAWKGQWPAFRGPGGDATAASAPDFSTARVLWKSGVDLPGWNSPIVWGDHVFLSGADKQQRAVYCYSASSGRLAWKRAIPTGSAPPTVSDDAGYAPSTMATDGEHVAAIFVNGDIVCFDFSGKLLWTKHMGSPENTYGHASSLAVYGSGLLVQFDQGSDPSEGKSALFALDFATGKTVWKVQRPVQASWSTPVLAQVGKRVELITCATPWVIAYDPDTGAEIWRASCLSGDVAPSAAAGSGLVFACNQGATLAAIRAYGSGDVTKTAIAWSYNDDLPDIESPLAGNGFLYMATSEGVFTCLGAETGKKIWREQYDSGLCASPILTGKQVCLLDHAGVLHFISGSSAFREIGKIDLGEECRATPAVAGRRLFVRSKDHLICLGGTT